MEWSKAKSILILVFIILNIFLFTYLNIYIKSGDVSKEVINTTFNILKDNGVNIDPDFKIPKYGNKIPMLILENESNIDFNESHLFDPDNIKNIEKTLKKYLLTHSIKTLDLVLDEYKKNSDETFIFVFIEKYKDFFLYDNKIILNILEGGKNNIKSSIKKVKGFTKTPSEIMPAHQVLLKYFYNKKGVTIRSIDIGFKGFGIGEHDLENKETFQGPAWRIVIDDGRKIFLNAYNGEEIE
jgi:regulatory protein YycI of two-component signal transduction system YycFG